MLKKLRESIDSVPRFAKRAILMIFDIVALAACVWGAYCLRLNQVHIPTPVQFGLIVAAPLVALPVFMRLGLYRSIIRYLPERAIWTILQATTMASLLWVAILFLTKMSGIEGAPRAVPLIYWALASFVVGGSRFGAKYLLWMPMRRAYSRQVFIYGAGPEGAQLAEALQREGSTYVAGFIDDNPSLHGRDLAGLRVHSPDRLPDLVALFGAREVILSTEAMDPVARREIVGRLSAMQLRIRALPAVADVASGHFLINQLREIDIDDILGRSSVPADPDLLRAMLNAKTILVTGAGGSIGSELCRLIAKWDPKRLILFEANEFALYEIDRHLSAIPGLESVAVLGSVTDVALVRRTLTNFEVDTVFHAAAHKHVPLVEQNALEGIRNNILGTKILTEACFATGVKSFVLISTDKAVRPVSVMGATKRWAEIIVSECAARAWALGTDQNFCAVRFGNVLGSNGSVVPLFKEQIRRGGPVTLTDPQMTRYFMSIHEAAELIVQAGALSEGGDIFLLDMGEPVRISDLAENMIRLAGLSVHGTANPSGDIAIAVIGSRRGEKMFEELFYDPADARPTRQPKILRTSAQTPATAVVARALAQLQAAIAAEDEVAARTALFELVAAAGEQRVTKPDLKLVEGRSA